jgi:hypothetical protein
MATQLEQLSSGSVAISSNHIPRILRSA